MNSEQEQTGRRGDESIVNDKVHRRAVELRKGTLFPASIMNALFQAVLDAEGSSSFEEALRQEFTSSTPDVADGVPPTLAPTTPPSTLAHEATRESNDDTQAPHSPPRALAPCVPNWYQVGRRREISRLHVVVFAHAFCSSRASSDVQSGQGFLYT